MADEKQSTALARAEAREARTVARGKEVSIGARGIVLQHMADLRDFAETAVRDGVAPKGMNAGQAMMAIQAGLERGLPPLGGLQACVVINGVLSWRGWAAKALIQQSGLVMPGTFRTYTEGTLKDKTLRGVCVAQRVGYDRPFVRTFSIEDAVRARLWGKSGPWTERPGNMMEWRAIGDMARFEFAEVLGGIPIAEDVVAGGLGSTDARKAAGAPQRAALPRAPGPGLEDPLLGRLDGEAAIVEPSPESAEEPIEVEATLVEDGPHDEALDAAVAELDKRPAACPRCGDEESGFALLGRCAACNFPEEEPG